MKVCTVVQMRELDKQASVDLSIAMLMENAASAVAAVVCRELKDERNKSVAVLCGRGNNGGDGLAVARLLHCRGFRVFLFVTDLEPTGDCAAQLRAATACGLKAMHIPASLDAIPAAITESAVVVDAIFGSGLSRPIRWATPLGQVIAMVNSSGKVVVAVDIPSGVEGDSGIVREAGVIASTTVTFGLPKIGNILNLTNQGRLLCDPLSFPPLMTCNFQVAVFDSAAVPLPPRNPGGHKGSFGKALFIAGSNDYFGAARFSSVVFLRAGGGYARLACPERCMQNVSAPQLVMHMLNGVTHDNVQWLADLANSQDFVVVGPGLGLNCDSGALSRLISSIRVPLLIDGDGLTLLAIYNLDSVSDASKSNHGRLVLTPHLAELSRLTGRSLSEMTADFTVAVEEGVRLAHKLKCTVVVKGPRTAVVSGDGRVTFNMSGNSGMGTAGSGDVLAGVIPAIYCHLRTATSCWHDAVAKGVFLHGVAGDIAAEELGEDAVTAEDILVSVGKAMKREREGSIRDYSIPAVF